MPMKRVIANGMVLSIRRVRMTLLHFYKCGSINCWRRLIFSFAIAVFLSGPLKFPKCVMMLSISLQELLKPYTWTSSVLHHRGLTLIAACSSMHMTETRDISRRFCLNGRQALQLMSGIYQTLTLHLDQPGPSWPVFTTPNFF